MDSKKVWFITGAKRGLGFAIARTVLSAGYNVVATSRDILGIEKALGTSDRLLVLKLDVTDSLQAEAAVAAAIDTFGKIDVLVNNAGYGQIGWFENTSDEQIRKQFKTNVFGTMAVTRAVLPHMRAQRSGQIFTISSIAGFISSAGYAVHSASKFALEGWMEGLAMELQPLGINATIIAPGYFNTDFLDDSSISYGLDDIKDYSAHVKELKDFNKQINHRQIGDPRLLGDILVKLYNAKNRPLRFSAGSDAYSIILDKAQKLSAESAQWRELSTSSDDVV